MVYTDGFQRVGGKSKYFAYLDTYVLFVEQPVVSLSLCNGAIQSQGHCSKLHILHKFDNTVHWVFAYRRCGKPDNVQFMKSREKYVASFDALMPV